MPEEDEELWCCRDSGYLAELHRLVFRDGSVLYSFSAYEENSNYGGVFMYWDRKALKDLRAAIDYVLDEKDRKGKNGNV